MSKCVVVILTFNCASIVDETISQARKVCSEILAVDSFSTDGTPDILRRRGCDVVQRPFSNYADQRNWAICAVEGRYEWQLHLDADEVLDDLAIAEIKDAIAGQRSASAFMLRRRDYFMGKMLRFSGVNPWHLRLFRSGVARCEDRLYDQHFVASAPAVCLKGVMHDRNSVRLSDWVVRHNRWSDLEVTELLRAGDSGGDVLAARLFGDARERTRWLKRRYYQLPGTVRALGYFFYRYGLRLGFLDGRAGFYYAFFQALWFRMLIDAKLFERTSEPPSTILENQPRVTS